MGLSVMPSTQYGLSARLGLGFDSWECLGHGPTGSWSCPKLSMKLRLCFGPWECSGQGPVGLRSHPIHICIMQVNHIQYLIRDSSGGLFVIVHL